MALGIGGVWVERFGVKCLGILLRTWSKAQGRDLSRKKKCYEAVCQLGRLGPYFSCLLRSTAILLGVFAVLGSRNKFAIEV